MSKASVWEFNSFIVNILLFLSFDIKLSLPLNSYVCYQYWAFPHIQITNILLGKNHTFSIAQYSWCLSTDFYYTITSYSLTLAVSLLFYSLFFARYDIIIYRSKCVRNRDVAQNWITNRFSMNLWTVNQNFWALRSVLLRASLKFCR